MSSQCTMVIGAVLASLLAGACSTAPIQRPSSGHIRTESLPPPVQNVPKPVQQTAALPKPKPTPRVETYSVVVNNVRVQELLFALARDAKLNVDIHSGISGTVTLNAIDQTLPQLLNRIAKQVDMRFELDGPNLVVMPDTPFLRTYRVDYVNMTRDMTGTLSVSHQITGGAGTGASTTSGTGGSTAGAGNTSTTEIKNTGKNHFWASLEKNVKDLLHETDKVLPEGSSETVIERADVQSTTGTGAPAPSGAAGRSSSAQSSIAASPVPATLQSGATTVVRRTTFREAASVIVNAETGVINVRATTRQHEKVQEFLDHVSSRARQQVLIEATIAEVALSDRYQQGIDWQYLRERGSQTFIGQGVQTQLQPDGTVTTTLPTLPSGVANTLFSLAFSNGGLTAAIRLLESFGNVKVLSSPKLSVLNNQTAVLKLVENRVFFTIEATQTTVTSGGTVVPSVVTARPNTVPIGLVMSVTPQIGDGDNVTLNVRPSISRLIREVPDPTPALAAAGVTSLVPEILTREMESVMRVADGEIAVLGGLMQDETDYKDDAVPGLWRLPLLGNLFTYRNDYNRKIELVIFLRPVIVRDPSLRGDYRGLRDQLPDKNFFEQSIGPRQLQLDSGERQ